MKLTFLLPISTVAVLTLAGCAGTPTSQQGASMNSMPMAMMSDKEMMDMCMSHMRQMSPEMRQRHMEMMQRHHQMMTPKPKSEQPG